MILELTPIAACNKFLDILIAIVLVVAVCNLLVSAFSAFVPKFFVQFLKDLCFAVVLIND
jgi:hypothetical protein